MIKDTPPSTVKVVLWHVALDSEQHSLLVMIFLERQSACGGLTTVAALQRSGVVEDFHRRDVCREKVKLVSFVWISTWACKCFLLLPVELTVFGDVNRFLCAAVLVMIHTGQVLPLVMGQTKLISQPGFLDLAFILWLQGCLALCVFGKNPGEVGPDTLPSAVAHCQPEGRITLSLQRHAQQMGSWKRKTMGDGKRMSSCASVSRRGIFQRVKQRTVSENARCSFFRRLQARMLHRAGQILTRIQRRLEVHGAMGWCQTTSLNFSLWQPGDAAVTVSNMPGYGCCRGDAGHRAVHICELMTVSPLSVGADGDVWASCVGKRSETTGSEGSLSRTR